MQTYTIEQRAQDLIDDDATGGDEIVDPYSNGIYGAYLCHIDAALYWVDLEQHVVHAVHQADDDNIYSHLAYWDNGDMDPCEWLAEWNLDGLRWAAKVAPTYSGPCRVWHEPHYYTSTCNSPTGGWARDDQDNILEFCDMATAQRYVAAYYDEPSCYDGIPACNVLSHGQAAPDTLTICEA